jgi:endonuclease/exonuclease/phosphatase family metal-dependent hydrolase
MRASAVRLVLALVLAAPLCPAAAQAQSFVLLTQNVLRFGHGRRLQTQCDAITAASLTVDIIVLQEVMQPGYPCLAGNNNKGVNGAVPANFHYFTSGPKGQSSYQEYYGILVRTNQGLNQITPVGQQDANNYAQFARPPFALLLAVRDVASNHTCNVWIVDFHAVFGKTIGGRRAEAAAMRNEYVILRATGSSVVMAGDWNLPADDGGFGWVAANNAGINPNVPTSLTTAGVPSSAYDHLVYTSNANPPSVTITQMATYTGGLAPAAWRATVSDHVGVMANVSLTC